MGSGLDTKRHPEGGDNQNLESGEIIWIEFTVHVPQVVNGMPLAGSKHNVSVMAQPASGDLWKIGTSP